METITYTIEIKWKIINHPKYGFGVDKCLYNLLNKRKIKQSYNSGSIGYWIDRKFITLKSLRSMVIKTKKEYSPF